MHLDDIDHHIVAFLLRDGRASFRRVGDAVGLSAPAVKRRVDRLVAARVIRGFTARVDPDVGGPTMQALVAVTYAGNVTPARIAAILEPMPHVVAAYTVSGDADALVLVRARDTADFERALEVLRGSGVVARTQSTIVLSTLLDRARTGPLPPDDSAAGRMDGGDGAG